MSEEVTSLLSPTFDVSNLWNDNLKPVTPSLQPEKESGIQKTYANMTSTTTGYPEPVVTNPESIIGNQVAGAEKQLGRYETSTPKSQLEPPVTPTPKPQDPKFPAHGNEDAVWDKRIDATWVAVEEFQLLDPATPRPEPNKPVDRQENSEEADTKPPPKKEEPLAYRLQTKSDNQVNEAATQAPATAKTKRQFWWKYDKEKLRQKIHKR